MILSLCSLLFAAFQVDECYFCKSSSFSNTPSLLQSPLNGYQDELFLLNPNEKPLCDTDPLLLFCIDVSGSMKITSEVQQHYRHLASRGCLWQQVFMNTTCGVSTVFRCQRESILWINPVSRWVVFLFSPYFEVTLKDSGYLPVEICGWEFLCDIIFDNYVKRRYKSKIVLFPVCPRSCVTVRWEIKRSTTWHKSGAHLLQPWGTYVTLFASPLPAPEQSHADLTFCVRRKKNKHKLG